MNELSVVQQGATIPAVVTPTGDNYNVSVGKATLELQREVDFGKIPGTTKPCLFKSGAERILMAYGISTNFVVEKAIEDYDGEAPFFYFRVKCECFAAVNGQLLHITDGMGSANSNEKQCGRASKWDVANARLKIAKKRAMVDAVLLIGQLSNAFSQDIENEDFMEGGKKIEQVLNDDDPITVKQRNRIYALAAANGISTKQAKKIMSDAGFETTTAILQKDYDNVCALFSKKEAEA